MPHVPSVGRLSTADLGNLAGEPDTPLSSKTREWCLLHGCALTLLSPRRSKTAAGESELPGQPEMGLVGHSCSRESVGMEDPLASVFIVATELTHSLSDTMMHFITLFLVSWRRWNSERLIHITLTHCPLQPGGFEEGKFHTPAAPAAVSI